MRDKGFKSLSFLVHEDDADNVRAYINQLKNKRLKQMVLTPSDTLQILGVLNLSDGEFALIHHNGSSEPVTRHINYLKDRARYQENSKNYVVSERLKYIEDRINDGVIRIRAIGQAVEKYPFK